jgi:sulfur-carrier protein
MIVKVLFFAEAREAVGQTSLELPLDDEASVGELRQTLAETYPALGPVLPRCSVSVDQVYAGDERTLYHGAEVGLIPPVGGG